MRLDEILFPKVCPLCDEPFTQYLTIDNSKKDAPSICEKCESKVTRIKEPVCKKCGRMLIDFKSKTEYCDTCKRNKGKLFFEQNRSGFLYQGDIVKSMYKAKYDDRRDILKPLSRDVWEANESWIRFIAPEVIIPVPLYKERKAVRGYNQAEYIAKEISLLTGIKTDFKALIRIKNTLPQKELNDEERKNNLTDAFNVSGDVLKYEKVLLVDDIYTTGSTLSEAAKTLKKAGVEKVFSLCLCSGKGD